MCYRHTYFSSDLNLIKAHFLYNSWKLDAHVYITLDNIFYHILSIQNWLKATLNVCVLSYMHSFSMTFYQIPYIAKIPLPVYRVLLLYMYKYYTDKYRVLIYPCDNHLLKYSVIVDKFLLIIFVILQFSSSCDLCMPGF